jgi:uncharacterized protein YodC (DUF2158 family)
MLMRTSRFAALAPTNKRPTFSGDPLHFGIYRGTACGDLEALKAHFPIVHSNNLHGDSMAEQFKVGDVVQLKSGGPLMTVGEVSDEIWCVWFEKSDKKGDTFHPDTLKKSTSGVPGFA